MSGCVLLMCGRCLRSISLEVSSVASKPLAWCVRYYPTCEGYEQRRKAV
jgi:hypothetical protein